MNQILSDELVMFQKELRRFVAEELTPIETSLNLDEHIAREDLLKLRKRAEGLGLWLYDVPEEHGGLGLNLVEQCIVQQEISKTTALPFRENEIFSPMIGPILYEGNPDQIKRFLEPVIREEFSVCFAQTEPDAGSDPGNMRTRAVRGGDVYYVSGTKRFITSAARAKYAQVICVTDPEKGKRGGISCLMVDMESPGVEIVRNEPTMMGDTPGEISFDNVPVPVENRIGDEGEGFRLAQDWITIGRVKGQGARCVGIAERSLSMAVDYANNRTTFGMPLSDRQAVQFMLADSAMEIELAKLLVYDTAARFDNGANVRDASFMTKIYCTEMASRVVDRSIQIHGGVGLTKELPLEYWYRQLRSIRITEGPTEVLRWRLARSITRSQLKQS